MNTSYLLGRPEWANNDDEAANEFAASSLSSETNKEGATPDGVAQRMAEWRSVAACYWAEAYIALEKRDFVLMRNKAQSAQSAERNSGADAALLKAIFGGEIPSPPYADARRGAKIPRGMAEEARKAVLAEIKRHADAKKPKVEETYRAPELDKSEEERAAVIAAAAASLPKNSTGVKELVKAYPGIKEKEVMAAGFDRRAIFASGAKTNRKGEMFI